MANEKSTNKEGLKLITQKSMALVNKKEVVLPSTYRVLFSMLAKKDKVDIGAESIHTNEEISEEVYKHILAMDANTSRAIQAIKDKDETELQIVLDDANKLKREIEALKQIAYEDGLTKALNRKWLLENYLDNDEVFTKNGVIALIDLNDFKMINDTMGHAIGDKILASLAARLMKLDGHVVRYGGDEFVIIFDNNTQEEVKDSINILRELHLKKEYRILEYTLKIKFAYGVNSFKPGDTFSEVIDLADKKMYEDKEKVKQRSV